MGERWQSTKYVINIFWLQRGVVGSPLISKQHLELKSTMAFRFSMVFVHPPKSRLWCYSENVVMVMKRRSVGGSVGMLFIIAFSNAADFQVLSRWYCVGVVDIYPIKGFFFSRSREMLFTPKDSFASSNKHRYFVSLWLYNYLPQHILVYFTPKVSFR